MDGEWAPMRGTGGRWAAHRMFLTFFWRMEPAESVAKPACMRKTQEPAQRRKKVLFSDALVAMVAALVFIACTTISTETNWW